MALFHRFLIVLGVVIASLLGATPSFAQVTPQDLMGLGMPGALAEKVASIGTGSAVLNNNSYIVGRNAANSANINLLKVDASDNTVINSSASDVLRLQLEDDAQRLIDFSASSDTVLGMAFGDGGTTAVQGFAITAGTADADDDGTAYFSGGGGGTSVAAARGAFVKAQGADATGDLTLSSSATTSSIVRILAPASNGSVDITVGSKGLGIDQTGFAAYTTGTTLSVDSGTAASACKGTGTFNGTTAVPITTTCAATGMHVSITPTATSGGTASHCWFTNIVNATSFDVDCDAANTATFSWVIIKEG